MKTDKKYFQRWENSDKKIRLFRGELKKQMELYNLQQKELKEKIHVTSFSRESLKNRKLALMAEEIKKYYPEMGQAILDTLSGKDVNNNGGMKEIKEEIDVKPLIDNKLLTYYGIHTIDDYIKKIKKYKCGYYRAQYMVPKKEFNNLMRAMKKEHKQEKNIDNVYFV